MGAFRAGAEFKNSVNPRGEKGTLGHGPTYVGISMSIDQAGTPKLHKIEKLQAETPVTTEEVAAGLCSPRWTILIGVFAVKRNDRQGCRSHYDPGVLDGIH
jgi:hypothetical protein